jgi:ankyrin repeat protein
MTLTIAELWDIFSSLLQLATTETVFIIIDALDECDYEDLDEVCQYFDGLMILDGNTKFKLFITSRPTEAITQALDLDNTDCIRLEIKAEMVSRDIEKVTLHHLQKVRKRLNLTSDEVLMLQNNICDRSGGMFVWAVLAIKELAKGAAFSLYGSLESQINNLPQGLTSLYEIAWHKLNSSISDPKAAERARRILSWLLYAARPLTLAELNMALAIEPMRPSIPSREQLYRNISGLVMGLFTPFVEIIEAQPDTAARPDDGASVVRDGFDTHSDERSIVRIFHQSALEYLLDATRKSPNGTIFLTPDTAHESMALTCIAYLQANEAEASSMLSTTSSKCGCLILSGEDHRRQSNLLRSRALLEYACRNWPIHVRCADTTGINTRTIYQPDPHAALTDATLKFLTHHPRANAFAKQVDSLYRGFDTITPEGTPLHQAADLGLPRAVQSLLREPGCNVNLLDPSDASPLHIACRRLRLDNAQMDPWAPIIDMLLKQEPELEVSDSHEVSLFSLAVHSRRANVVREAIRRARDHEYQEAGSDIPGQPWRPSRAQLDQLFNAPGPDGQLPIHSAVESGNLEVLDLLLDNGADPDVEGKDGRPPLHYAIVSGTEMMVSRLLRSQAANLDKEYAGEQTALGLAVSHRQLGIVKLLLEHGARPDIPSKFGPRKGAPLHMAIAIGALDIMKVLVEAGASDSSPDDLGHTPLVTASHAGQVEVVKYLLNREVNVHATNKLGQNALQVASSAGYDSVVNLLVSHGATVDATEQQGWTALHLACSSMNLSTVELLLRLGSDIEARDRYGRTPLLVSLEAGRKGRRCATKLLSLNANKRARTHAGTTALHIAATYDSSDLISLLMDDGIADLINAKDTDGLTPLHLAAAHDSVEAIDVLLRSGAEVNSVDCGLRTPFLIAMSGGNLKAAQTLLLKGAQADVRDLRGMNASHYAAKNGDQRLVKFLLRNERLINLLLVADESGQTPLHLAAACGSFVAVQSLLSPGFQIAADSSGWFPDSTAEAAGFLTLAETVRDRSVRKVNDEREPEMPSGWVSFGGSNVLALKEDGLVVEVPGKTPDLFLRTLPHCA